MKNEENEIKKSKKIYEDFFKKEPIGYRFPLGVLRDKEYKILKENGFKFDSSIFPTYRPGFFNNLDKPLNIYNEEGIIEIPFSVISKTIRIPLSLSYIKLFYPLHFLKKYNNNPLIFDFHIHDLYMLNSTKKLSTMKKLPYIRYRDNGVHLFLRFCNNLKEQGYESIKISKVYEKFISDQL